LLLRLQQTVLSLRGISTSQDVTNKVVRLFILAITVYNHCHSTVTVFTVYSCRDHYECTVQFVHVSREVLLPGLQPRLRPRLKKKKKKKRPGKNFEAIEAEIEAEVKATNLVATVHLYLSKHVCLSLCLCCLDLSVRRCVQITSLVITHARAIVSHSTTMSQICYLLVHRTEVLLSL